MKARELEEELKGYLGIAGLKKVRIFSSVMMWRTYQMPYLRRLAAVYFQSRLLMTYIWNALKCRKTPVVFSGVSAGAVRPEGGFRSAVRAVLKEDEQPIIKTAVTYLLIGTISDSEFDKIKVTASIL